jgi:Haem-binding domain
MRRIFIAASLFVGALFGVTFTGLLRHPERPPANDKPLFQGAQIDEPTLALFQRACQNCHSENTQWPWYSRIPPASWMIAKDVNDGRSHVNFSNWGSYRPDKQDEFLTQIGVNVRTGRMPLPRYTLLHREAVLASHERQQIYEWSRAEKKRLHAVGGRTSSSATDAH